MTDIEELASKGFPSAAAVLDSFQPDVRDKTVFDAIKSGALKAGLSVVGAVYGKFSVSQAIGVLARGAWAL